MLLKNYHLLTCLILFFFIRTSYSAKQQQCKPSSCGTFYNISHPFRLKDDPKDCGDPLYEISCENNTRAWITLDSREYQVRAINYQNLTIRVADTSSINSNDTCSFPLDSPDLYYLTCPYTIQSVYTNKPIIFIACPFTLNDSMIETDECVDSTTIRHTYIQVGHFNASHLRDMCTISFVAMTSFPFKNENNNTSLAEIHDSLLYGFELSWGQCAKDHCYLFKWQVGSCGFLNLWEWFALLNFGLRFIIGVPFLLGLIIYKLRRLHLSMFDVIEGFLQSHNNLMPIRYSYSDIKKMTKGFREKLGQGGYGSVYKGKLRSGNLVAVKVLSKPSTNGQDFINEVATIGRIHHINVVELIGYCAE